MFYNRRIKELEVRVESLVKRVNELAHRIHEQNTEIDRLCLLIEQQATAMAQKPKPKYRPKKHNGKETPKATE